MNRLLAAAALCTALAAHAGDTQRFAKDFSAEMWLGKPGDEKGARLAKIAVHETRVRFEISSGEVSGMVGLANLETHETTMLMPSQKMAMTMKSGQTAQMHDLQMEMSDPDLTWDPVNGPCGKSKDRSCRKLGSEKVDGRDTTKWEMVWKKKGGEKATVWVDASLQIPVKNVNESGRWMKMKNIVEGAQPAELFAVPADYRVMEMPARGASAPPQGLKGD